MCSNKQGYHQCNIPRYCDAICLNTECGLNRLHIPLTYSENEYTLKDMHNECADYIGVEDNV